MTGEEQREYGGKRSVMARRRRGEVGFVGLFCESTREYCIGYCII